MLQQFTIANWASFKDAMTLSLEASTDTEHEELSVISVCEKRLLKSAVIYGANASGKSNLITAMQFCRTFVLTSSREGQVDEEIPVDPYRLSVGYDKRPSHFEIIFLQGGTRFRYGFEADKFLCMRSGSSLRHRAERPSFLFEKTATLSLMLTASEKARVLPRKPVLTLCS